MRKIKMMEIQRWAVGVRESMLKLVAEWADLLYQNGK